MAVDVTVSGVVAVTVMVSVCCASGTLVAMNWITLEFDPLTRPTQPGAAMIV